MNITTSDLPIPPLELRRQVGATDPLLYDNPGGELMFPEVDRSPEDLYEFVLDFGCGCGRLGRKLIQQRPQPARYLGLDLQAPLVNWCQIHLSPCAERFEFHHHDVHSAFLNPDASAKTLPFPVKTETVSLFIAWSVFTHLLEEGASFYLEELARVLKPGGVAITTWFLFDKTDFPMMQTFQNALFINSSDPTNAVIFDRAWLLGELTRSGLVATRIVPPAIRGFQWMLYLEKQDGHKSAAGFPEDIAPRGIARPPHGLDAVEDVRIVE
jgi:SAM-dependent methyltransferase